MPVKTPSIEDVGQRWMEGSARAVREVAEHPTSKARYDWALDFAAGDIRKITYTPTGQASIRFSHHHLKQAQLESVDKVRVIPLPEGGLAILPATPEEIEARHRLLTDYPPPTFPESEAPARRELFKIICVECGQPFRSQTPRRVFCDSCIHARSVAQKLEWWRRNGWRTPSYLAKLKAHGVPAPKLLAITG